MDASKLDQAREYAQWMIDNTPRHHQSKALATAELILSLPDQIVDGGKLAEIITHLRADMDFSPEMEAHVEALESLLPAPPTLADIDEDAVHAYGGKGVKVEGWDNPFILVAVYKDEGAVLVHDWTKPWPWVEVRPLSELTPVNEGNVKG